MNKRLGAAFSDFALLTHFLSNKYSMNNNYFTTSGLINKFYQLAKQA